MCCQMITLGNFDFLWSWSYIYEAIVDIHIIHITLISTMDVLGEIFSNANYAFKVKKKPTRRDVPLKRLTNRTTPSRPSQKVFNLERHINQMLKPNVMSSESSREEALPPPVDEERARLRIEASQQRKLSLRKTFSAELEGIFGFKLPCKEEESVELSDACQSGWKEMDLQFSLFSWEQFSELGFWIHFWGAGLTENMNLRSLDQIWNIVT